MKTNLLTAYFSPQIKNRYKYHDDHKWRNYELLLISDPLSFGGRRFYEISILWILNRYMHKQECPKFTMIEHEDLVFKPRPIRKV